MAGNIQRAFWLFLSLCALNVQLVAGFINLQDILTDTMEMTESAMAKMAGIETGSDQTPMNIQNKPGVYKVVNGTAQYFKDRGSKRATLKYGPFHVQSMDQQNGMVAELQLDATMPCSDCTITWMQAGLEYPNGTYANANTSLWLHHTVFINIAHPDTVCGSNYYGKGQRWFASGNERTVADYSLDGRVPVGYYIGKDDYMVVEAELMNQQMEAQDAVMSVEYEYVPGKPDDFYSLKPMWLDIAGCDIPSDMPVKSNTTFTYSMNQTYAPDWHGALIGMGAHLHDGGTHLNITNNNKTQCDSMAYYGGPGFIGPSMSMNNANQGLLGELGQMMGGDSGNSDMMMMEHISYMSSCYAPYVGMVAPGDEWSVTAWYDFTKHAGMTNTDGSLSDIMGISVIYTAENMTAEELAKYAGKSTPNPTPPQPASVSSLMHPASTMAMSMSMSM